MWPTFLLHRLTVYTLPGLTKYSGLGHACALCIPPLIILPPVEKLERPTTPSPLTDSNIGFRLFTPRRDKWILYFPVGGPSVDSVGNRAAIVRIR